MKKLNLTQIKERNSQQRLKKDYPLPTDTEPTARSNKEQLINDIVDQCICRSETEKANLRKRLAITANTCKWSEMDLHALLKKKQDPTIRNYSAFVNWSCKITNKQA